MMLWEQSRLGWCAPDVCDMRLAKAGLYAETVPIFIRFAAANDYDVAEKIENIADSILIEHLQPQAWWPATTASERAAAPGFMLIAVDAETERIAGFAHIIEVDGFAHLEQLSVLPEFGRRGYGRRLVEAAAKESRRRGHAEITLRTFAEVPWNAPFYATCGFIESEPITDFHRGLVDVERNIGLPSLGRRVQMTKPL